METKYPQGFKYIRIYPQGTNVESWNYDPAPYLYEGAQIVALNSQHVDEELIKYIYLFNNNTGYRHLEFKLNTEVKIKIEF